MPGSIPGVIGATAFSSGLDEGTLQRTDTPPPVSVGTDPPTAPTSTEAIIDPDIEALNLRGDAKAGAYALRKAHPQVTFTSGRRDKADQARAMASNVVHNRKWIEQTYVSTSVSRACQQWVDNNPKATTQDAIAEGLLGVLNGFHDDQLALLSRHLSGDAFDVQPVQADAAAIKRTIRGLKGLDKFLEKEGGLVRWHAQF